MHFVVTLVERDYLLGACVLFNSLIRNGFDGRFIIGFRDFSSLPSLPKKKLVAQSETVYLMELDTHLHFSNYKPSFMLEVLERYPECTKISYFDPDIVVHCPFSWIDSWSLVGPVVCADVNWSMPSHHPTRREWLERTGMSAHHQLELYFNSGFLSLQREFNGFLLLWQHMIERWGGSDNPLDGHGDIGQWRKGGRWLPFMSPNQDTLNIALMVWQGPITTLGPDVMGFTAFGEIPHAVGSNKPWQRNFLVEAIKGNPPRFVDRVFWSYADEPLALLSTPRYRLKALTIQLAALLTRFYSR
jgi:hypothetical protein